MLKRILYWLIGDDFKLSKTHDYLHTNHTMNSTGVLPGILMIAWLIFMMVTLFFEIFIN